MLSDDVAFADVPAEDFPMRIEFYRTDTKEVIRSIQIDGPGALQVPGLGGPDKGFWVGVRVTTATGEISETEPDESR